MAEILKDHIPKRVLNLMATPLIALSSLANAPDYSPYGASHEAQYVAVELIRRAIYLEAVSFGRGHSQAVKDANRKVAKVRRALGYTYPQKNITF